VENNGADDYAVKQDMRNAASDFEAGLGKRGRGLRRTKAMPEILEPV
jgi:hypothetical protein